MNPNNSSQKRIFYLRLISILIILLLIVFVQFYLSKKEWFLNNYIDFFFLPLQKAKTDLLSSGSFSFGDIIYAILIILVTYYLLRSFILLIKRKKNAAIQRIKLLSGVLFGLIVYFFFSLLWNINYNREKITQNWVTNDRLEIHDSTTLLLQNYVVTKIKELDSTQVNDQELVYLNQLLKKEYASHYGTNLPKLYVQKSLFGNILQNIGIQGYYNPVTSEAQYNHNLPRFMHAFVIAHEMAHQMGIAREGDANLVGYSVCVNSSNQLLQYSAYMNLFIYNNIRLYKMDSSLVDSFLNELPQFAKSDMLEREQYRKKYKNQISRYTIPLYNLFLKINGQNGIEDYRNLSDYVYIWEIIYNKEEAITIYPFKKNGRT